MGVTTRPLPPTQASLSPGSLLLGSVSVQASCSARAGGQALPFLVPRSVLCLDLTPGTHRPRHTRPHTWHAPAGRCRRRPQPPPTHPTAACHHERRVVVAVLEATVSATADQRAHEREEPTARRRVQRRAPRVHLGIHVGAVLRAGARVSTAGGAGPRQGRRRGLGVDGGWDLGARAGRSRTGRAALKQPARASKGRSQRREGSRVQSGRKGSAGQGPGRMAGSARLSRAQAWAVLRTGRIGRGPGTSSQPAG